MARRVAITALNMITSLGLDLESSWSGLVAGRSGVRRITLFDPSDCITQFAAQAPDDFDEHIRKYCHKRMLKQTARGTALGYACARDAIERFEIDFTRMDRSRCGVVFGVADTGHSRIHEQDFWVLKTMTHAVPALLSIEYGLEGPSLLMSSACASSAYAIGVAYDLITSGRADFVIAGGCSSIINPEHIRGFNELRAISTANHDPAGACKPFSLGRDGFVIGEGAGVLVLESMESAESRGAAIFGEMLGHAMTNDGFNLMSPRPEGAGMLRAMRLALDSAGLSPDAVDYVNAHGTSTVQNDKAETQALKQLFGERAYKVPVSGSKSMIGHTAGACGAVEAVITVQALRQGVVPPTINYVPDPELDLDYVPHAARRQPLRVALSNSFGFGGCNASLVFGSPALDWPPGKACEVSS